MANLDISQKPDEGDVEPRNQETDLRTEKVRVEHESAPFRQTEPHGQSEADQQEKKQNDDDPFKHLPEHEKAILKRQLDLPAVKVNYMTLYRYATRNDKIILVMAGLGAIIGGALLPLMTVLFGQLAGTFQSFSLGTISASQFTHELGKYSLYFVYLAIGEFVMVYLATAGFLYTGEHISSKIREQFLAAILRQNIAFFDGLGAGEITTRITADTNLVQEGLRKSWIDLDSHFHLCGSVRHQFHQVLEAHADSDFNRGSHRCHAGRCGLARRQAQQKIHWPFCRRRNGCRRGH